jgi:hypothetical protein
MRKAEAMGANISSQLLHERVCHEFGAEFHVMPERFLLTGKAKSDPDVKPLTEAWWYAEQYANTRIFPGDKMEVCYLMYEREGVRREGVGIVIRETSVGWLPKNYAIFAIVAEFCRATDAWLPAVSPG